MPALMLVLASCGGDSQIADIPTPETKVMPSVEVEPSPTNERPQPAPTKPPTPTEVESPTPTSLSPAASTQAPTTDMPPTPRSRLRKPRLRTYDLESLGIPRFVGVDWIELDKVGGMSKFRSGIDHDFSHLDVYEAWGCRSMKHYFFMRSSDNLTNIFSPQYILTS